LTGTICGVHISLWRTFGVSYCSCLALKQKLSGSSRLSDIKNEVIEARLIIEINYNIRNISEQTWVDLAQLAVELSADADGASVQVPPPSAFE
jgi:hypothetical protein